MRVAAVWGALALATLGGVACGSDDGGSGDARSGPPVVGEGLPPEVDHPVTETIDRLQQAFADEDYAAVCAEITPSAARAAGEAAHGDASTCERDIERLFGLIQEGGGWRHAGAPRVVDVRTIGPRATATIALDERWQAQVPLVRKGGRWLLNGFFGSEPAMKAAARPALVGPGPSTAGPAEVAAAHGSGERPCPALEGTKLPAVAGGCRIEMLGEVAPVTILTPFGDFDLARCAVLYTMRVDASGRTWTEDFEVGGGEDSPACGDVNACYDPISDELLPWRGRIRQRGDGTLVHRMDMCLNTCVGVFVGELELELERDGDRWRAEPVAGGGSTGIRLEQRFRAERGDVAIETVG